MITVNAPFMIALIFIIFIIVIKWIEWYLFQGDAPYFEKRGEKRELTVEEGTVKSLAKRLKSVLFFSKAELKRPWYIGLPYALLMIGNQFLRDLYEQQLYVLIYYFTSALILLAGFETFIMLRKNKDYFSIEDRKRRYMKSQAAQFGLAILLVLAIIGGLQLYYSDHQIDPVGVRESVDWAIEPVYQGDWPQFTEGLAPVGKKDHYGFINKEGALVIPFRYDEAKNFHEDLAPVKKDGKWGFLGRDGHEAIPFIYDEAFGFDGGVAPVKKNDTWMVINNTGEVLFETEYQLIYPFHEGVAMVEVRDKQYKSNISANLIDQTGRLLFSEEYDILEQFNEGCVPVWHKETKRSFFLDKNGQKVIPQGYLEASSFSNGYATVQLTNGEYALIDHLGNIIKKLNQENYYDYRYYHEGIQMFYEGEWGRAFRRDSIKYGFADWHGNVVIPANFRNATDSSEGMIGLKVSGLWGFVKNPLPEAARGVNQELWKNDKTQIGTVEGIPVYAGELEGCAYSIKMENPELAGIPAYRKAFEQIKMEKAFEKYGKSIAPERIQYQIGDPYYKRLLLGDH